MRRRMRGAARVFLILLVVVALGAGLQYARDLKARGEIVVLVSPIEGSGTQSIEITERLAGVLAEPRTERGRVVIRRLGSVVTKEQGSSRARALGHRHRATLVVWGYLEPAGGDARLTGVVETLAPPKSLRFSVGEYVVEGVLAEPDTLVLTRRVADDDDLGSPVRLATAALHYRLGAYAEAVRLLHALADGEQAVGGRALLLMRGNASLLAGRHEEAVRDYTALLQSDPQPAEVHGNLGLAYAALGDHTAAAAEFEAALAYEHEDGTTLYLNRGVSQALRGEHEKAIADYSRVLRLDPRAAKAHMNRGVSRAALGDHERAIEDFSRALHIAPTASAHLNRGLSRAALGHHRQAIGDFSRALRLHPADSLALVGRGRSRSALGDQAGAVTDHTAALEVDPQLAIAYYERGIAYMVLGRHHQALEDFSAAIRINPGDAAAYKGRGVSRILRREYPQALDDLSRAIQLAPRDAEAFFHRGIAYRLQGTPLKAIPDMEKVLELSRDAALRQQAEEQVQQIRSEEP